MEDLNMTMTPTKLWIRPWLSLSILVTTLINSPASAQQTSITVNVSGIRSQKGNIMVCLWNQDKGFPVCSGTAPFKHTTIPATTPTVTATFQNVPPGEYAISAFHDENQNSKIDRGFMGKPKEGLVFSNVDFSKGNQRRPSFDQSKFMVNGAKTISLSLMYF
jgi:uncharacterized protein (DUF2141 family)